MIDFYILCTLNDGVFAGNDGDFSYLKTKKQRNQYQAQAPLPPFDSLLS